MRSPSPSGSSHSLRKSRRPDERDDRRSRDYGRLQRRSKSPEYKRRHREHDNHRVRDRSRDRRDYDRDRYNRRGDSRDRRRYPEENDRRHERSRSRSRDRKPVSRFDDRNRRGEPDSRPDSRENGKSSHNQLKRTHDQAELDKPSALSNVDSEAAKKAERLAKLQAWKQKQLEAKANADHEQGVSTPRSLDSSHASPRTPEPATAYAGRFDAKAIAKKAQGSSSTAKPLGIDLDVPSKSTSTNFGKVAAINSGSPLAGAAKNDRKSGLPLKARGNVSGFGLGKATDNKDGVNKPGFDLDEEEQGNRKLEKLLPLASNGVADEDEAVDDDQDAESDTEMIDSTEEEMAAAARAAGLERHTSQNMEVNSAPTETNGDKVDNQPAEEEDEIDPLDAFMTEIESSVKTMPKKKNPSSGLKQVFQPEAMYSDDEENFETEKTNTDDILAMASKKKKKDIPTVDHKKMGYAPFRKDFYTEPSELSELTEEEIADLRLELDGIKVRGVDIPKPVQKWSQCGLGIQTLDVISKLNYEKPSSIQSQAIPAIMSGRDVIGVAKTGSGKTIAFLLPMFRHIMDQPPLETMDGPIALIMTPTRELATQIHRECKPFLKALNINAVCAYGGAPIKDQIADFKRGAQIVVCTPGRMIDLLAANSGRVTNLRRVTYLVLDEADRMFDMGFEPQVTKIVNNIRPDRQTVLFSATFPRQMEVLAKKALTKPIEIVVGGRSVVAPEITQLVEVRSEDTKFLRLLELLGQLYEDDKSEDDRALVFVDRQEAADGLLRDLMRKGYPCMSIHGGKDQNDRDSTIADFKAGVVPILIATSVAARGLDVKQLKLVVNFDAPNHLEDYVHRAGRTGRAGNTGTAVTFVTEDQDRYSVDIAKALKQSGQPVPPELQALNDKFMEKVKSGKEKASGSGFGGKGLERLDQERDAARARERRTHKTGDEADEQEEKDDKALDEEIFRKAASGVQSAANAEKAPETQSDPPTLFGVPKGIDLDGEIKVIRTEKPAATATSKNPLDRVSQAVANINNRLSNTGVLRSGVPIDNKGPDAGAFHATLEINDFPQKARWAVTNRTNVAKILEATGTSITTKGSFYPTGKEPGVGENPKLYILVEGDTELVVTNAMRELMRLLKEGTIASADSDSRAGGRYSVV